MTHADAAGLARRLGALGVWTALDALPAERAAEFAQRVEALGYGALWVPEAVGRDPFAFLGFLATRTSKLVFATGIANIYARDAVTFRAAAETLAELSGGRFVLGLGVSHVPLVSDLRGHRYTRPVETMRHCLEAIEKAPYSGPRAEGSAPVVIAALRQKMLGLAAEACAGAHPYLVPPEHTRRAREILGEGPLLAPEQMVLLESDADAARQVARKHLAFYLRLPNYRKNLLWLGYAESDLEECGSDRLVDDLVAWGDADAIRARIRAHHDAGADHVCIQPFRPDGGQGPHLETLEELAPEHRFEPHG